MLRDPGVRIKTVDYIEHCRILRCLLGKICCRTAADNEDIDLVLVALDVVCAVNDGAFRSDLDCRGITSCEYCNEGSVGILLDGSLNSACQVAVT